MDNIYLFFVVALFILAISDLVVGVGNDAVNFLNSAIGSKVASMKVILGVASLGVLLGATFSSGMMEVARSGVFHPDQFYFNEIMVIFLAVMITDIILLDTFNTFGLPTSTTVSIVFELLGAAVAVSIFKIYSSPETLQDLGTYINSARALAIISGILLSVVIAFTVGSIVQFFSRLLFTFNYEKNLPYFGAVWGSIAITSIIYFILVKGASGASFMTPEAIQWIHDNTFLILTSCFVGFTLISQFLISVFKINILRIIVLIGTFSIAMAFAGNDLVNFIGVPLAGYESFKLFVADPSLNPATYTMESLLLPVQTPTGFLLAAGIIMIFALIFSKKARSVTQTEVDLARQGEGYERFSSSIFAQTLVRKSMDISKAISRIIPERLMRSIDKRFDTSVSKRRNRMLKSNADFDMVRASVNMFVASILIALATSLKLPLSTTYVTFMVAMGTSLSDRAWGRESAVYRITGVITVIGGWFFTAFTAFSVAFLFAMMIIWGSYPAAIIALIIAFSFLIRTNFIHKKRSLKKALEEDKTKRVWTEESVMNECNKNIRQTLGNVALLHSQLTTTFIAEDRRRLKKVNKKVEELNEYTKVLKNGIFITLKKLEEDSVDTGHHYVQILDYLRETAHCLTYIAEPFNEHLDNAHPATIPEQESEVLKLNDKIGVFYKNALSLVENKRYGEMETVIKMNTEIISDLEKFKKLQIKLIKADKVKTKNSLVIFNYLSETKNMLLYTINLLKSHRDFVVKNGY
jgi:phosphate/sulfate permease